MRTVEEYLEKAEALETLATTAANDLLRSTYLDLARGYRDLARERRTFLELSGDEVPRADGVALSA